MVGAPFHRDDHVVVVVAEGGSAVEHADLRARFKLLADAGDELHRVGAFDGGGGREEAAAGRGRVVDEDHPRARARRGERRHQPGRSGPDHEHVAEGVAAVVVIGVRIERSAPEPRRPCG